MPTQTINLNDALPAAPANSLNVKWQADAPSLDPAVVRDVSANVPAATATTLGVVKGDAATVIIAADGTASVQELIFVFGITDGSIASAVTLPVLARRAGVVTRCAIVIQASDGALNLSFRIKKNGADVFTTDPTVVAGTAAGTVAVFSLSSASIAVARDDVFTMDITVGSSSWKFTAQLE
jgi:hypothetical protein